MKFVSLILFLFLALNLSALDFGVDLSDASIVNRSSDTSVIQANKATLWVNIPFPGAEFSGEGVYDFSYTWTPTSTTLDPYRIDLGIFKVSGLTPLSGGKDGVMEWDVGRVSTSDLSGWLLNGKMDGLNVHWQKGPLGISFEGYYTGLVLKKNSRVQVGSADKTDSTDATVAFAPKRVVGSLGMSYLELFARQDLNWEVLGQFDLRSSDPIHTVYSTVQLTGPLPNGFRYQVFGTGSYYKTASDQGFGFLAGSQLSVLIPWQASRLVWDTIWAARIGNDSNNVFTPIAGKNPGTVSGLTLGNGAATGVDFSFRPIAKTSFGVKAQLQFRTTDQVPSILNFDSTSKSLFLGTEGIFYASWLVSSEFSIGLTGGAFFPSPTAFQSSATPTYTGILTANLQI